MENKKDARPDVSIIDLIKSAFDNIKLIICIAFITISLTIIIGILLPEKSEIKMVLKINSQTNQQLLSSLNIPIYTTDIIVQDLNNPDLKEKIYSLTFPEKDSEYSYLFTDELKIQKTSSNTILLFVSETKNAEDYFHYINNLVNEILKKDYFHTEEQMAKAIEEKSSKLVEYKNLLNKLPEQTIFPYIINLSDQIGALKNEIINLEKAVGISEKEKYVKIDNPFLSVTGLVIASIIGVFIACIYNVMSFLMDKHCYCEHDLIGTPRESYIGSIPAFANNSKVEKNYLKMITDFIPSDIDKLNIISINPKAGKTTLATYVKEHIQKSVCINDCKALKEDCSIQDSEKTVNLVIIKAGTDTIDEIMTTSAYLSNKKAKALYCINFVNIASNTMLRLHTDSTYAKKGFLVSTARFYRTIAK